MNKYAIFFAATGPLAGRNYLPDTNALLNSLSKCKLRETVDGELTVYLLHHGFDPAWKYPERAAAAFDFNLIPVELRRDEVPHPQATNNIEFVKRARYFKMLSLSESYDAVCLLDADMFCVAPEFGNFFRMVTGTKLLVGANERFKWDVGPESYYIEGPAGKGESLFADNFRMHAMTCNVPSIFDMRQWRDVFGYYCKICFDGYQIKNGQRVGIGDLFAHNLAIYKCNRQSDVIMLPMESFAQVHHVWRKPWTHMINDGGRWRSWGGDRVYWIHDSKRLCKPEFIPGNIAAYRAEFAGWNGIDLMAPKIEAGMRAMQREWYDLNFNQRLSLYEFLPKNVNWENLK